MTKIISDVDACVEGMRKFTTEVFDTGAVMIAYMVMLLFYDWMKRINLTDYEKRLFRFGLP